MVDWCSFQVWLVWIKAWSAETSGVELRGCCTCCDQVSGCILRVLFSKMMLFSCTYLCIVFFFRFNFLIHMYVICKFISFFILNIVFCSFLFFSQSVAVITWFFCVLLLFGVCGGIFWLFISIYVVYLHFAKVYGHFGILEQAILAFEVNFNSYK